MNRPNFTIARLMTVVLLVALGFAAMRRPSEVVAGAAFTSVVVTLIVATTGSLLGRGASWIGFTVFGWGGLILIFGPLSWELPGPSQSNIPAPKPLTTFLLADVYRYVAVKPSGAGVASEEEGWVWINSVGGAAYVSLPFIQVGQSLISVLFACVGSFIGPRIATREVRSTLRGDVPL
jgi:hypothetical protein